MGIISQLETLKELALSFLGGIHIEARYKT
jgi:hypothetical protein